MKKIEGKKVVFRLRFYGRFLSISKVAMAMAMIMAIAANMMQVITDVLIASRVSGVAVGIGVADASDTLMKADALELPQELDPVNRAMIWYVPGTSGIYNNP